TPINYIQVASMPCSPEAMLMTSQDPEMSIPSFILNLEDEEDLEFRFSFVTRQGQAQNSQPNPSAVLGPSSNVDTIITGLTFAYASNAKELDNLVTRQFHADPNIQAEEHTSELQSPYDLVCRLLLEKKKKRTTMNITDVHKSE